MSLQLKSVQTSTSATRAEPEMSFTELREEGYVLDLVRISAAAGEAPEPEHSKQRTIKPWKLTAISRFDPKIASGF